MKGGWWAWLGALVVALSVLLSQLGFRWAAVYLTPLVWTGVVLLVDGMLFARGRSWLASNPKVFILTALVSVPSWVLFEFYDRPRFWLHSGPELWWHYHGLPPWPERGIGYLWSFATITPAVLLIAEFLSPWARGFVGRGEGGKIPKELALLLSALGAMMASFPLIWPSEYFAADVWVAWVLLLDPINLITGKPSLLGDLERGNRARVAALAASGLVCGVIWESVNWLAHGRWTYTVPFAGNLKVFEMPILGYFGFIPFAWECFAIWSFLLGGKAKQVACCDEPG